MSNTLWMVVASMLLTSVVTAGFGRTPTRTIVAHVGDNVTINCSGADSRPNSSVYWIHPDNHFMADTNRPLRAHPRESDGSIVIVDVSVSDAKTYTCADAETNDSLEVITLDVKSVPPAVTNLSVQTRSVYARVTWQLPGDGGYPVKNVVLAYRLGTSQHTDKVEKVQIDDHWETINDLQYTDSSRTVYGLKPNSTYYFRVYAVNALGPGPNVSVVAETKYIQEEIDQANQVSESTEESSLYMKITIIVVIVAILTFAIIALGISLLLFRNCTRTGRPDISCETTEEEEAMELVPHITLNPSFNIDMLEYLEAEEESPSDDLSVRVNSKPNQQNGPPIALFGDRSNLVDISAESTGIARPKR